MATATLYPNTITLGEWSVNTGTPVAALKADDTDTTYVYSDSTVGNRERFTVDAMPADAESVNSATYYFTGKKSTTGAACYIQGLHYVGTTYYYHTAWAVTNSYATKTEGINYQNGASPGWTVSNLASTSFGFRQGNGGAGITDRVTYYYLSVDYNPSSGFAFTYCLPLIGILMLSSMGGFMWKVAPNVRYEKHELENIYRDIKNSQRGYSLMDGYEINDGIWRKQNG